MSSRARSAGSAGRVVLTAGLIALLVVAIVLSMLPAAGVTEGPSARSVEEDGRRGMFRLLASDVMGYLPEIWASAPVQLPSGANLLILSEAPPEPSQGPTGRGGGASRYGEEDTVARSRLRDPLHYGRFMMTGGTLLAPAHDDVLEFLVEDVELPELVNLKLDDYDLRRPRDTPEVFFASGASIQPRLSEWVWFEAPEDSSRSETLVQDEDGNAVALRFSVGRGACVLLASDELLSNAKLSEGENALFFVRLMEELEPFERVLFDEYALGFWAPPSPVSLALSDRPRLLTLHIVALGALLVWRAAGRRVFPRDPPPVTARSALVRAEGFAGLLLGSGRVDLLARLLRDTSARRLSVRVGARSAAGQSVRGVDPTQPLSPEELERTFALLGPEAERQGLVERARALYLQRGVADEAELEGLAKDLSEFESDLQRLQRART